MSYLLPPIFAETLRENPQMAYVLSSLKLKEILVIIFALFYKKYLLILLDGELVKNIDIEINV